MPEAVIVAATRSPIGRANRGSLKDLRADDLAATIVRTALDHVPALETHEIDDLMLGCGMPGGEQGFNMARVVSILAGLDSVPGTTVNRYCASSLQSARMAAHAVRAGEGNAFIAAGVEMISSFSRAYTADTVPDTMNPMFAEAGTRTELAASAQRGSWTDPRASGLLPDAYIADGQTAENVARLHGITRADQDEFALNSQRNAERAIASGFFAREITPVSVGGTLVTGDDSPRGGVTMDALAALEPVFRSDGSVTAGNCCPLNDGAAALVIMNADRAKELGIPPLARILSTAVSAISPEIMGMGPVASTNLALARADMSMPDVDLVEINEAFAAQVVACARELNIDMDRLNVHGGAIALGHPFGMTGARTTCTLINGLRTLDKQIGLQTMCIGGGMGMAMVVERLS